MAQTKYCNSTTDLYRAFPRIEEFKEQKTLRGWVVNAGSVYKKGNAGQGELLFENNLPMVAVASIATVAAGKFFYDSNTDTLYAQSTTGTVVDGTNVYLWGIDWETAKDWAVEMASARVDALLDPKYPIPVPENPRGTSTQKWDLPLTQATALLACSFIAGRKEPPKYDANGTGANIAADLFLAAKAYVDGYNDGSMMFTWQLSQDEIGGAEAVATSTNTSVGMFQLRGTYSGTDDAVWILKIVTGGVLGTATYALSEDNGTTYGDAATTDDAYAWDSLSDDVEIRFFDRGGAATSFVANDTWKIYVVSTDNKQSNQRIGSIQIIG